MKKKLLNLLIISAVMFISGCEDAIYNVYNDFTGPVESVSLQPTMSVVIHTTEQLKASVYPSMTENKAVTWEIVSQSDVSGNSATGIATIDSSGRFTGNVLGSAIVRVTTVEGGFTSESVVSVVSAPIAITSLTLDKTSVTIGSGQSANLIASFVPTDATSTELTWTSSNSAVANVSGTGTTGTVTGGNLGTATITVASVHWNKSATCTVNVGETTFSVTYKKNDGTSDEIISSTRYKTGENFTVYPASTFSRTYYTLSGWTTQSDGSGTPYTSGAVYSMGSADIVLYAQWTHTLCNVTYSANGATTGTIPTDSNVYVAGTSVTVKENTGNLLNIPTAGTAEAFKFGGWNTKADGSGDSYTAGSGSILIAADTVLYAKWVKFETGDTGPGGGWIFYDKGSFTDGWRYLEAAPSDLGSTMRWCDSQMNDGYYPSGTFITSIEIGEGLPNTTKVIARYESESRTAIAAVASRNYTNNSISDWFLPSVGEIQLIYSNLHQNGIGGFKAGSNQYYWTSTEDQTVLYWYQYSEAFSFYGSSWTGNMANNYNYDLVPYYIYVRPARRF